MFSFGKNFWKTTDKQVHALKSLNLPNKINELKQIENVFLKNQVNDLIIDIVKEIVPLQNNIRLDDLEYTTKRGKRYDFSRYPLPIVFLRDIPKGNLSIKDADKEQIQIANELKDMGKGKMPGEKKSFLKNAGLLLNAREKILNNLKRKLFPAKNIESEPDSDFDSTKISKLTDFWKKTIRDGSNINTEIFGEYFKYQNSSFLLKDLYCAGKNRNKKIVNNVNNALIELRSAVNRTKTLSSENPEKVIDIVAENFNFYKQEKWKGFPFGFYCADIKILSH